jgi:hypothetical protein
VVNYIRNYFLYIYKMKKKLTLWIMLLPAMLLAQENHDSAPKTHHKKSKKVFIATNPNAALPPVPDEVKPDFSRESIFKALFVGGMNFSQIEGSGEARYRKYGAVVGGGTVIKFSRRFSVSVELLYSQKGARPEFGTSQVTGQKNKFDITSDYVDLPFTFSVHDKKTLMFGAGLQVSVLARYQQTDSAGNNVTTHPPPNGEPPHKVDLLGQVSGTFFIKQRLGIGLRFAYSLLGIRDAVADSRYKRQYNNTISLRISYLLDPKHVKWSSKIP